ncbi:hypothetical protein FHS42_005732 [Streptomyces zagrosensis]|uniref:Uncharacterized protein n=1 Tax=Streptomyces zagrosensis TaxID=1042984 RepID=A0A7W9V0W0_9ACTN|nr:hypothetical protein [Streptomyces zagrosensis]
MLVDPRDLEELPLAGAAVLLECLPLRREGNRALAA